MPKFKDNCLEGILYCLHSQGKTASEAHSELQKLTGEDPMTLEKIELLFMSIKEETFSLKELTLEEKMELSFQAPSVQKRILANTDLKSRLALRETSQLFRQLSFNTRFHIDVLSITWVNKKIEILADEFETTFGRSRHEAENRLKNLLSNILRFKRLTIDVLEVSVNSKRKRDFILARMKEVFDPLDEKSIHVNRFWIESPAPLEFLQFLRFFNPAHFKFISLDDFDEETAEPLEDSPMLNEILQSDAWKGTPSFSSLLVDFDFDFLNHCCHFTYCRIHLEEQMDVEKLIELKEKLLKNHNLRSFKIYLHLQRNEVNEIKGAFGSQNSVWANLSTTEGEKLSVRVTKKLIWFRGPCYAGKDKEEEYETDEESGAEYLSGEESGDEDISDEESDEEESEEEDSDEEGIWSEESGDELDEEDEEDEEDN